MITFELSMICQAPRICSYQPTSRIEFLELLTQCIEQMRQDGKILGNSSYMLMAEIWHQFLGSQCHYDIDLQVKPFSGGGEDLPVSIVVRPNASNQLWWKGLHQYST